MPDNKTNKDSFDAHLQMYVIDGKQRFYLTSVMYLTRDVGLTQKESTDYLTLLRYDAGRV